MQGPGGIDQRLLRLAQPGPSEREQVDEELLADIERIYEDSKATYGSPRIHESLKDEGWRVGRNRVIRLMQENDIRAVQKRRSKRTTDSNHDFGVADNLLERDFEAAAPIRCGWPT